MIRKKFLLINLSPYDFKGKPTNFLVDFPKGKETIEIAKKRTKRFILAMVWPEISLTEAFAAAYLQGIYDGVKIEQLREEQECP